MMEWANKARADYSPNLNLLAVTVLTSMDEAQLRSLNVLSTTEAHVKHLADLSLNAGIQGLVCSSLELSPLRARFGNDPIIVTPGIRPTGSSADEQKRIMTPHAAATAGSSYIVVGRPILKANDPAATAAAIRAELNVAS
jgi:orotidine-5'-phosphate decarboxylase